MTCSLTCLDALKPLDLDHGVHSLRIFPLFHIPTDSSVAKVSTTVQGFPFLQLPITFAHFPLKPLGCPFSPTVSSMHFCPPFSPNANATCFRLCYNHTHFQELNLAPEESSQKEWLKTAAITILFSSTRLLMRILFSSTRKSMQHFRIECWKLRPGQSVLTELVSVEILESRVKRI